MSTFVTPRSNSWNDSQTCWVCFATNEDDETAVWVKPCRCKGTSKWVHQQCLQRWIDEKQKGNATAKVCCPQCNTEYLIVFPPLNHVMRLLSSVDTAIVAACPLAVGGIFLGVMYWSLVTHGALTVMQVLGPEEGLAEMGKSDPVLLLLVLPTIPVTLCMGRLVPWDEYILRFYRRQSSFVKKIFGVPQACGTRVPADTSRDRSDPMSLTRLFCGALLLPSFAWTTGNLFFSNTTSNVNRTLLGGMLFLAVKGGIKLYYKQQQYNRQAHRLIHDFEEPPPNV